jgi:hypothetical protein
MIKKITRLSVLSATVAATSCLGMSSIVSADSITLTGPGSTNVISSNSGSRYGYTGNVNSNTWNSMNPATWQSNGRSFATWWTDMMSQMSQYRTSCWMSQSYARDPSWTPSGDNWQASWSNWNPFTWESNGQNFANWRGQVMSYLSQNYGKMMKQWVMPNTAPSVVIPHGPTGNSGPIESGGSSYQSNNTNNVEVSNTNNQTAVTGNASSNYNTIGGNVNTGNANNENEDQTNVNLTNSAPNYTVPNSNQGYGNNGSNRGSIGETGPDSYNSVRGGNGGSIGDTGPDSYNSISNGYNGRSEYSVTNSNTISSNTSNSQYASTGNASSNGNTIGGNVTSGSSSNGNGSYGSYDARNN